MNKKKKPINGLIILTIIAAATLYSGYLKDNPSMNNLLEVFAPREEGLYDTSIQTNSLKNKYGHIRPQVVDGFSEEPVYGATIVIPETNQIYKTDEDGYTPPIKLEVIPDSHFNGIQPKSWGEATLIAYKEGYIEYVLLQIHVWEGKDRQGPKIFLFPQNSKHLDQPMSIVEGPNQVWINSLVEKYRP